MASQLIFQDQPIGHLWVACKRGAKRLQAAGAKRPAAKTETGPRRGPDRDGDRTVAAVPAGTAAGTGTGPGGGA